MEWTNEHDLQLLVELRARNLFTFKRGSPESGRIWEEITETLNSDQNLKFYLKDKRAVRDRWNLLQGKCKRKRREEEGASGIEVEEPTQKDILREELCELEDTAIQSVAIKNQDKKAAEDTRNKAMERLAETKKRKQDDEGGELQEKKTRRRTSDAVGFLSEKMKVEQAFHQEELVLKRKEQELLSQAQQHNQQQQPLLLQQMQEQNSRMQEMHVQSLNQQQQQNQMMTALLQKLITRP